MTRAIGVMHGEIVRLLREGWGEAEILRMFKHKRPYLVRSAINNGLSAIEREPLKKRGPWPVSYVRSTGEKVYRVGTGHDVPEGSLQALGFEYDAPVLD